MTTGSSRVSSARPTRTGTPELGLSARAHDKILRTAGTIADLDGSGTIQPMHLNEAINYRMLD